MMHLTRATRTYGTFADTCHCIPLEKSTHTDDYVPSQFGGEDTKKIPGLHDKATVKANTEENLPPLASHDEPLIHSPLDSFGSESISTDNENWVPGSYRIKPSGIYGMKKINNRIYSPEVSFVQLFYICEKVKPGMLIEPS